VENLRAFFAAILISLPVRVDVYEYPERIVQEELAGERTYDEQVFITSRTGVSDRFCSASFSSSRT
jgi:hypothetical protein